MLHFAPSASLQKHHGVIIMTPRRFHRNAVTFWLEAPFVMSLRLQQMQIAALTGKPQDAAELQRMVVEKLAAAAESAVAVNMALSKAAFDTTINMMMGEAPSVAKTREMVVAAAVKPFGKRVRANSRRLANKK